MYFPRALLACLVLPLFGCDVGEVFPLTSGIYVADDLWLDVRVEDELVLFHEDDGGAMGDEVHRNTLDPFIQEERGDACGDGLWYEAATLDDMVTFQLGTTFYTWPYLLWDCDQVHLLLSEDSQVVSCDGDDTCLRFAPL